MRDQNGLLNRFGLVACEENYIGHRLRQIKNLHRDRQ
jgi:hypothetical protein